MSTPGDHLEQLDGELVAGADPGRREVDLARIGLGVGDELRHRLHRHRRIDHDDLRLVHHAGDRGDVADEVEAELRIERRVDRRRRPDREQRVAVRRRAHDRLGGDVRPRPDPVVDDERLPELLRQPLRDHARQDVLHAAGGGADHQPHRPCRIGLRPGSARERGQGGARSELQELAARTMHDGLIGRQGCACGQRYAATQPAARADRRAAQR